MAPVRGDRHRVSEQAHAAAPQRRALVGLDALEPHDDPRGGSERAAGRERQGGRGQEGPASHGRSRARTTASATCGPRVADLVVLAGRVHAVREQDDVQPALGVHPHRGAGEAGVAEGPGREERAGRRVARLPGRRAALARLVGGRVPAERARGERDPGPLREQLHRGAGDDPPPAERAPVEERLREVREVGRGGEEARVGGDAAQGEGVLVVHLAAHDAAAPRVVLRRRDAVEEVRPAAGTARPSSPGARARASRASSSNGVPLTRSRMSPSRMMPRSL